MVGLGCIGAFVSVVELVRSLLIGTFRSVVLISWGNFEVSKADIYETCQLNFLLFYVDALIGAARHRKHARHCLFVRALKPRGPVLFNQWHTPDSSRSLLGSESSVRPSSFAF